MQRNIAKTIAFVISFFLVDTANAMQGAGDRDGPERGRPAPLLPLPLEAYTTPPQPDLDEVRRNLNSDYSFFGGGSGRAVFLPPFSFTQIFPFSVTPGGPPNSIISLTVDGAFMTVTLKNMLGQLLGELRIPFLMEPPAYYAVGSL